jgi:hypothetical protein
MIANSVQQEPEIILEDWATALTASGSAHFLGTWNGGCNGRLSTEIVGFDLQAMTGAKRSGRRYALGGRRHDFMGVILWATMRGRSGGPMPDFISVEELDLALRPAARTFRGAAIQMPKTEMSEARTQSHQPGR